MSKRCYSPSGSSFVCLWLGSGGWAARGAPLERPLFLELTSPFDPWGFPPVPRGGRVISRCRRQRSEKICSGPHLPFVQGGHRGRFVSRECLLFHPESCSPFRCYLESGTNTDCLHQWVSRYSLLVIHMKTCYARYFVYVVVFFCHLKDPLLLKTSLLAPPLSVRLRSTGCFQVHSSGPDGHLLCITRMRTRVNKEYLERPMTQGYLGCSSTLLWLQGCSLTGNTGLKSSQSPAMGYRAVSSSLWLYEQVNKRLPLFVGILIVMQRCI